MTVKKAGYDAMLLLAAIVEGRARWEPSPSGGRVGEVCVNGLRYFTSLDGAGCPVLHSVLRAALVAPILAPAAPKKSRARGKKEKLGGGGG